MFQVTDDRVTLLTDTLACELDGAPAGFVDKVQVLPHLSMAITGNGFGGLADEVEWALRTRRTFENGIDAFNDGAQAMLTELWPALEPWRSTGASGDRATLYVFGWSQRDGACRGFSYKSENGFDPRPIPVGAVGISPVPSFEDYDSSDLEGWVDLACRLRGDHPTGRTVIGGDLMLTVLTADGVAVARVHRFADVQTPMAMAST